jgi:hypothetical protein
MSSKSRICASLSMSCSWNGNLISVALVWEVVPIMQSCFSLWWCKPEHTKASVGGSEDDSVERVKAMIQTVSAIELRTLFGKTFKMRQKA